MQEQQAETWTTRGLPGRQQFRNFQEVFERTHFHWDLKGDCAESYHGSIVRRHFDDYVFTHIEADPLAGRRTADDIKRGDQPYFCLLYLEAGQSHLAQGANECDLTPGSIALWDSTRPAFFDAKSTLHQFSLLIPHRTAKLALPGIEDLCGMQVRGDRGMGALLMSHLKQLHSTIDSIDARDRPAVLRATVEMAAATFRPTTEALSGTAFRRSLLARVQEYVIANLSDPGLGPQTIASAFRFSPRYLHRLFAEFEMTVCEWIRQRRLARARVDMETRGLDALSITQIAMKNGFSDSSHFSRSFRAEFGSSPRDWREASKAQG